jgi:hypothetical protein
MSEPGERYSAEETPRRGDEIYDRQVRAKVEAEHCGEVVAIDVQSAAYAPGETAVDASKKLLTEYPRAQIWLVRIGDRALHRIGFWARQEGG